MSSAIVTEFFKVVSDTPVVNPLAIIAHLLGIDGLPGFGGATGPLSGAADLAALTGSAVNAAAKRAQARADASVKQAAGRLDKIAKDGQKQIQNIVKDVQDKAQKAMKTVSGAGKADKADKADKSGRLQQSGVARRQAYSAVCAPSSNATPRRRVGSSRAKLRGCNGFRRLLGEPGAAL
ncbi:hypothetical protein BH09ACT8_BH09ACT8_41200 [soil metagenome]